MKNLDAPLSEEVAKQAGKKINSLKSQIADDKDLQNSILRDYTNDARIANKFIKKICVTLLILCFFLSAGIVGTCIYNQHLIKESAEKNASDFMEFLNSSTLETSVDMITDTQSTNSGNIEINK